MLHTIATLVDVGGCKFGFGYYTRVVNLCNQLDVVPFSKTFAPGSQGFSTVLRYEGLTTSGFSPYWLSAERKDICFLFHTLLSNLLKEGTPLKVNSPDLHSGVGVRHTMDGIDHQSVLKRPTFSGYSRY